LSTKINRKHNAEAFLKALHVAQVVLGGFVPLAVTLNLGLSREATRATLGHAALTSERGRRKRPTATVGQWEEPETALVELNRVDIDLPPVVVREYEVRGAAARLGAEADGGACLAQLGDIYSAQNDVEVGVGTGLLPKEGVNAPAAVEPHLNGRLVESSKDSDNRLRIQPVLPPPNECKGLPRPEARECED
jgi:hypothetical protein